jgi:CelD/BcsL family acetyltransferase involved in cellulose biosynthesis
MASRLTYRVVPARHLGPGHLAAWNAIASADPTFASPFFRPEYTQSVAAVRDGVEVCLIGDREARDGDTPVGFFPFERTSGRVARPVGGGMSNFQAVIAAPGVPWDVTHLARALDVSSLRFHHQLATQPAFEPYVTRRAASPIIDVAGGWEAFIAQRERDGVSSFNALPRKMRKVERELGPLRFVPHVHDAAAFDALIAWKRAQYVRTETHGSLEHDWAAAVLRQLFRLDGPTFAGMLSGLYAGEQLIAVHAGMRSATAWHYWYPAYDPELGRYSPGLILLMEMCRWAADSRLERIDLGPGDGAHKDLFATSETTIGVGAIDVPRLARLVWRFTHGFGHRLTHGRRAAH